MRKLNIYAMLDPLMALLVMVSSGGAALSVMRGAEMLGRAAVPVAAFAAVAAIPAPAHAGPQGCTGYPELFSFADEQITVGSTAVGLTAATYAPSGQAAADMAVVTLETADLRYRSNGLNPTSAVGTYFPAPSTILVCGNAQVARLRLIRAGAVDGVITVQYSRAGVN